jgi:hypothetical protein
MTHQAVTYSLVEPSDPGDGTEPLRRTAFVPSGADPTEALANGFYDVRIHGTRPAGDYALSDRFWYVRYVDEASTTVPDVGSTAEIIALLDRDRTVLVISGPFGTRAAAEYEMDVRLEAPE